MRLAYLLKGSGQLHVAGPIFPPTEIPELQSAPLNPEDKRMVFACIEAVDAHLEKQPTTLRMKGELAAAILAMANSSAHTDARIDPQTSGS